MRLAWLRLRSIGFVGAYDGDECRRAVLRLSADRDIATCDEMGEYLVQKNDVKAADLLYMVIAINFKQQHA